MIYTAKTNETLRFSVTPPLCHPYANCARINAYYTYQPFDHDPFTIRAGSTSGSPVILTPTAFYGFMDDTLGGRFAYDGIGTLTVTLPAGGRLYVEEACNPYAAWDAYSAAIRAKQELYAPQDFWRSIEYCSWVDQKGEAEAQGLSDCHAALTEDYIYRLMARIKKLGLPTGKLTIDDGWDLRHFDDGQYIVGKWEIDRKKFPHMEQLVQDMIAEGFIPGLWFNCFNITPSHPMIQEYPTLLGGPWNTADTVYRPETLMFIRVDPAHIDVLENYYRDVFGPYIAMGFKKFKLDMSYAEKNEMKPLMELIYRVIKELDPTVEVEAHIPCIFLSQYCDTVRLNDMDVDAAGRWREVGYEHFKICRHSSYDRILNFDHIGGNLTDMEPQAFLEHTRLQLNLSHGYPCVSYLPDRFEDPAIAEEFVRLIQSYRFKE